MNRKYPHFAIPEIYGESLSYYELLRKLVKAMNVVIDNYDTIPDQIAEAVANLDASQLFSAVLNQIIESIATDNTKSTNAVKVYKKHDLLYATFNETVNLYEALTDFSEGSTTELIVGTNIRKVNISELFIELRKLIDTNKNNIEAVTTAANENSAEITTIQNDITSIKNKNTAQDKEITTIHNDITTIKNKNTAQDNEITTIHNDITTIKNKNNAQDIEIGNLNKGLNNKNKTFTLANTDQNGDIALSDNFRNYKFLLVILVNNTDTYLSSVYTPTELIEDNYKFYPSYTSDTQIVVYTTFLNGTTIRLSNNGNGHKIIVVGVDKINERVE